MMIKATNNEWRSVPWLYNTLANTDFMAGLYINGVSGVLEFQGGSIISTFVKSLVIIEYTKN